MAGRRFQDWTNQNLFISSFDSNSLPLSYQYGAQRQTYRPEKIEESAELDEFQQQPGEGEFQQQIDTETGELPGGKTKITSLQAAWNVTNAIQGMFIVGLPFAVKVGGWWAIFAVMLVGWVCYRTGLTLVDCLYEEEDGNRRKKVRHSYREVAEAVSPGLGKFVLGAQLTELASTCILYIVLVGDLLQGCFPGVDRPAWMMLGTVALLGTAFLDDLKIVSHLSLANAVSHLCINVIMVLFCLGQFSSWHLSSVALVPNRLFPTVIGVVVFGYTSHIFLPSLEGSMQNPGEFKEMLALSHLAAALFKAIFGLLGFLTFAEFTQKEISNSLPNQAFKVSLNLILVVKALLSYPLPYFATVQLLSDNFFRGIHFGSPFASCLGADGLLREWALALRCLFILWTLWMALTVPFLVELMGLIGNITGTVLSFIWPAYFHLQLRGHRLNAAERRFDKLVIGGGAGMCLVGVYYSAQELIHAIRSGGNGN